MPNWKVFVPVFAAMRVVFMVFWVSLGSVLCGQQGISQRSSRTAPVVAPSYTSLRVMVAGQGSKPLSAVLGRRATAVVFFSVPCPLSNGYASDIADLNKTVRPKGGAVLIVYANPDDIVEAQAHAIKYGLTAATRILDEDQRLTDALRARVTPEAFVLDAFGRVCYRGRIDDRYIDRGRPTGLAARSKDLMVAMNAVLAGKPVSKLQYPAFGCVIERRSKALATSPNYARDVAPILKQHCVSCHHTGEVGSLSFMNYKEARRFAANIASVTAQHFMPPWKPTHGYGSLKAERSLSDAEIKTLQEWAKGGMSVGDVSMAPSLAKSPQGWALGPPDLILTMAESYALPASGPDIHRCFVLPTRLTTDKQIVAVQYRPGNKRVVRALEGYLDSTGTGQQMDAKSPGYGYMSFGSPGFLPYGELGVWTPGSAVQRAPEGAARWLPAGADVVLQIYYHPSGIRETDKTQVGLYFAKKQGLKRLRTLSIAPKQFAIPAGEKNYTVQRSVILPFAVRTDSIKPHMHLLGRTIDVEAEMPDGTKKPLIRIENWDYNWQDIYPFRLPLLLPKGTRITLQAAFDNSATNPRQLYQPPRRLLWGRHITDEMCTVDLTYTAEDEKDTLVQMMDGVTHQDGK